MTEIGPEHERDLLAAEYSLGLLDGTDLRAAQELMLTDETFVEEVVRWELRLAPLAEEVSPVEPPLELWPRIAARLPRRDALTDNVSQLRGKMNIWRAAAAGMGAIAASLALIILWPVSTSTVRIQPDTVLIAAVSSKVTGTSLAIVFDQSRSALVVSPGVLEPADGRDHELWVIPAGGQPVSLGLVSTGAPQHRTLAAELRTHMRSGSTIAVSVEPTGGSPVGKPTGPVIAAGKLSSL